MMFRLFIIPLFLFSLTMVFDEASGCNALRKFPLATFPYIQKEDCIGLLTIPEDPVACGPDSVDPELPCCNEDQSCRFHPFYNKFMCYQKGANVTYHWQLYLHERIFKYFTFIPKWISKTPKFFNNFRLKDRELKFYSNMGELAQGMKTGVPMPDDVYLQLNGIGSVRRLIINGMDLKTVKKHTKSRAKLV